MKALTLMQPWATLIAIGAKRIETRSWSTQHRGPLAIHASARFPRNLKALCCDHPQIMDALLNAHPGRNILQIVKELPLGKVICTCELLAVKPTSYILDVPAVTSNEYAFGNYESGRYMWFLNNVKSLQEPVPAKGMLGVWDWPEPKAA